MFILAFDAIVVIIRSTADTRRGALYSLSLYLALFIYGVTFQAAG